jgi:8-oxo-dGTP diphosphatase
MRGVGHHPAAESGSRDAASRPAPDDPPAAPRALVAVVSARSPAARPSAALAAAEAERFVPLTTERLSLRPFRPEDAAEMHRLVNDWEVVRGLSRLPYPYPRELADEWIASTQAELAAGRGYHLAITGHEGEREILVGAAGLRLDPAGDAANLGYWVGRRYWGHGVATEAAGRLARWALANLPVGRITASAAIDNAASAAVLLRIGFRVVGAGWEPFLSRGAEQEVALFEATREDLFGAHEAHEAHEAQAGAAEVGVDEAAAAARPVLLVAAAALIDRDGRVLLARRPEGKPMAGLWEFPGGKVLPGETPEAALIRELREELGIDVTAACLAPFTFASHEYESFHLLMPLFLCRRWQGIPAPREGQRLAWVRPEKLGEYPVPPADKPLVPLLRDFL